jgi:hypothetical protein
MQVIGHPHVPAALLMERETPVRLNRRVGGPQNRSERFGEENTPRRLPGLKPRTVQSVA